MRVLFDLGDVVVGQDRPDAEARAWFEDEGVGVVFHARRKAGRKDIVGRLWLHVVDPREEDDVALDCLAALDALKARHAKMNPYLVGRIRSVFLDADYRSKGLGAALYVSAAEHMQRRHRAAIMADGCFEDGATSPYAARVWSMSRELRRLCDVEGTSAYYVGAR